MVASLETPRNSESTQLPDNCRKDARQALLKDPRRSRARKFPKSCPTLFEQLPRKTRFGPNSTNNWTVWDKVGSSLATFYQSFSNVDQAWPMLANVFPMLAKLEQLCDLAKIDDHLPKRTRVLVDVFQIMVKFGQYRPTFGPHRQYLAEFGPNLSEGYLSIGCLLQGYSTTGRSSLNRKTA